MKWYKYLFFYCLVFFCFSCNVFGIKVKDEPYPKDCKGNIITGLDQEGSNTNTNNSNNSCYITVDRSEISFSVPKNNPGSCSTVKEEDKWYKRDILLLIDNSWSMNGKESKVRKIFVKVANELTEGEKIYLKYFSGSQGEVDYSKTQLNTPQKITNKASKILKKEDSLRYGTNTYSGDALKKATKWVNKEVRESEHVPIVIFITDGYPTAYTNSENKKFELGYLSSANHFYKFAKSLLDLKNSYDALKGSSGKNKLITTGVVKPKFATIGLGISNDNTDMSARYLLTTRKSDYDNLKNLSTKDKAKKEDKRFYNLLNSNKKELKVELTFSVASNPDLGVVGYSSKSENERTIKFEDFDNIDTDSFNKKTLPKDNHFFALGPIKANKIKEIQAGSKRVNYSDVHLKDGYDGYQVIFFKKNDIYDTSNKKFKKITIKLEDKNALKRYHSPSSGIKASLNDFVDYYKFSSDVNLKEIASVLEVKQNTKNTTPTNSTISSTKITYSGLNSDYKYLTFNGSSGFVRHCSNSQLNSGDCSVVNTNEIRIKYFINYTLNFSGGTLKEQTLSSYPGGGFKFENISTNFKNRWYYASYAGADKNSPPVVEYKYNGDWYSVNFDSIKKHNNMTGEPFLSREQIWNKIDEEVQKQVQQISVKYKAISSNNSDGDLVSIDNDIDVGNLVVSSNKTSDGNVDYLVTRRDKIKSSCVRNEKFEYISSGKTCSPGYSFTNSSNSEPNYYIDGRYYFIPFGYKKEKFDVNINLNVAGKELSTTCSIKVNDGGSPCEPTNSSEHKSIEDQVSYRSIDKDNPFPRANNKYYSIPINWRSWYCSSSGTSGNCIPNTEKQKRLSNSYSNIYYSKKYSSQDLTDIAKQTLMDSKVYYSSWNDIDTNGKSQSIGVTNSGSTKIIEEKFGSTKSYCPLGSFKENCDQVMLK